MKWSIPGDLAIGIGTICVSVLLWLELTGNEARRMGMSAISSRTFPQLAVALLALLGTVLCIREARALCRLSRIRSRRAPTEIPTGQSGGTRTLLTTVMPVLGASLLYLLLIRRLGFYASSGLFLFVMLGSLSRWARPARALFVAVVTTGAFFVIFSLWLGLLLPRGMLR